VRTVKPNHARDEATVAKTAAAGIARRPRTPPSDGAERLDAIAQRSLRCSPNSKTPAIRSPPTSTAVISPTSAEVGCRRTRKLGCEGSLNRWVISSTHLKTGNWHLTVCQREVPEVLDIKRTEDRSPMSRREGQQTR